MLISPWCDWKTSWERQSVRTNPPTNPRPSLAFSATIRKPDSPHGAHAHAHTHTHTHTEQGDRRGRQQKHLFSDRHHLLTSRGTEVGEYSGGFLSEVGGWKKKENTQHQHINTQEEPLTCLSWLQRASMGSFKGPRWLSLRCGDGEARSDRHSSVL